MASSGAGGGVGWVSEGFNQGKQMGGGVPTLEVFKMCGCGIQGRGLVGNVSGRRMVGPDDLGGLFQL